MHHEVVHALCRLVVVPGVLDVSTAPLLKAELLALLDAGVRRLVVELALSSQIDSSGLAVLVAVQRRLHRVGGSLVVVIDNGHIADKFEAVGLHRILTITRSRDEAFSALGLAAQAV